MRTLANRVKAGELKVDEDDLVKFGNCVCNILKSHLHYKYYGLRILGKRQYLHRLIMNAPIGMVVDHVNGDTTDNRKENLRLCTNIENTKHLRKQMNGSTSQYRGVSFYSRDGNWQVKVGTVFIGRFDCEHKAAEMYNKYALKYYGEFANLNVINQSTSKD